MRTPQVPGPFVVAALLLLGCEEPEPRTPTWTPPPGQTAAQPPPPTSSAAPATRLLQLKGMTVTVPAALEGLASDELEELRMKMGGKDPRRNVELAVVRARKPLPNTVVQLSSTSTAVVENAGRKIREVLEHEVEVMKKGMIHPNEEVLRFEATVKENAIEFCHGSRMKGGSSGVFDIYTCGVLFVTADQRGLMWRAECIADPPHADAICGAILASRKWKTGARMSFDAVIAARPPGQP